MYKILLTYIFLLITLNGYAQKSANTRKKLINFPDSVKYNNPIRQQNSLNPLRSDSLITNLIPKDTISNDSVPKPFIEAPIEYSAEDSIIASFDGQKVFLYNKAKVTYQQIELTANYIYLDLETKEVYAEGVPDTAGVIQGKPVFKDGTQQFESKTLRYNFKTKKGIILEVVTEQGEGFVHSTRTKKISEDEFILKDGK